MLALQAATGHQPTVRFLCIAQLENSLEQTTDDRVDPLARLQRVSDETHRVQQGTAARGSELGSGKQGQNQGLGQGWEILRFTNSFLLQLFF